MTAGKKRLLTGIQSSGQLHIGNYFGALKPFLDTYQDFDSFLMVADYHALTSLKNPEELRKNIFDIVRDYLAVGIDPAKATIFQQSRIGEHTELAWILECLVPVSLLELGHAYKDKVAKGLEANVGLFNYPMLMAADIILYDIDVVPVGQDQKQHVEYAREAAAKFNNAFGLTFKEPREKIQASVSIVPGTDGKKMSKSYGNTIPLFATDTEITKAVMSIVTGTGGVLPVNVHEIHELVRGHNTNNWKDEGSATAFDTLYTENKNNYKFLKEELIKDLIDFITPMREKRDSITDDDVRKVIEEGSAKAKTIAATKMAEVRSKVGVTI